MNNRTCSWCGKTLDNNTSTDAPFVRYSDVCRCTIVSSDIVIIHKNVMPNEDEEIKITKKPPIPELRTVYGKRKK